MSRRSSRETQQQQQRHWQNQSTLSAHMQPHLQQSPQAMSQTQHYIPVQAPSQRGSSTDASAYGRHKHGKHRPKPQKSSRRAEYSDQSSVHSAQSECFSDSGQSESSVTTVSSATTFSSANTSLPYTPYDYRPSHGDGQYVQEPCPSVSDNCSDSGQSESSGETVLGPGIPSYVAPNHGHPEYSGYPRRSHRRRNSRASSVATSSVASFSVAPTTEYGGDDERSESNFSVRSRAAYHRDHRADDERSESASTVCGPNPTWHKASFPEFKADLNGFGDICDEVDDRYDMMQCVLTRLQSGVGEMRSDYRASKSSSIPWQPIFEDIRTQIDLLKVFTIEIESSVSGYKPPQEECPLCPQQSYGKSRKKPLSSY